MLNVRRLHQGPRGRNAIEAKVMVALFTLCLKNTQKCTSETVDHQPAVSGKLDYKNYFIFKHLEMLLRMFDCSLFHCSPTVTNYCQPTRFPSHIKEFQPITAQYWGSAPITFQTGKGEEPGGSDLFYVVFLHRFADTTFKAGKSVQGTQVNISCVIRCLPFCSALWEL